ncbi:sensor histidine kinase [Flavobacterium subsaxonicum]|uniref:histidine kinase n=1 Tax=Flavobacterium subsaxonicum WB 4.1-42 = DSM 21790 TaxID=1121898 RepID=A0A0A2N2K7_9FLAO|nr:ATP-binding protein [Flavobacterium subsaxonicum]KGO94650.1 histidine kinase [Flavobacterium subsaxonicum WB 4.1-42 = DSM 21790]
MKIKTKLILALGLLFVIITLLSALAIRQVNLLAQDTKNILVANYQSLEYSRNMYKLLDDAGQEKTALEKFQLYLDRQKNNTTEVGEQELTADLQEDFTALLNNTTNSQLINKVRGDLNSIMKLNMDAIRRKSNTAENTAEDSILWISLTSSFCLIIGFTLIVNLPGYIANPIRDLTESIRQIAAKNYSRRVKVNGNDEFSGLARSFNTMAEKIQEYSDSNLAKLMMAKERIETLINNLHDPVIGLDENNKILFINQEALKISGLKREVAIGKQSQEIALHNDLVRSLLQHLATGEIPKQETLKIYANNKESYFEKQVVTIDIIPTGETQSKQIGSFIILKNVTPYKELDFAKTNFIATVSHEFKTPIASMKMSLQLLNNQQTGNLNEEQQSLVDSIKDDTERLLRTTGELLNITQVETGKTSVTITSCDLDTLTAEAVEGNKLQAAAKHITIQESIPAGLPDILADAQKTTWIISNLISNAVRYSYENSVIQITAKEHKGSIELSVKDTGAGIHENYLPKIFDKYFRVPGTQKEGTGLGLAISKEFMEAQGATITVFSAPGEGSVFTLIFKRAF